MHFPAMSCIIKDVIETCNKSGHAGADGQVTQVGQRFANIIIDISHESVDRTFQYRVPEALMGRLRAGQQVYIPFGAGNSRRKGYVVELTDRAEYDESKLKEIAGVVPGSVSAGSQLIWLAWWMKERYGSTMNQALKTVLPVKQKVKEAPRRQIRCLLAGEELERALAEAQRKHFKARIRLLSALKEEPVIPYEAAVNQLNLTMAALKPMEEAGVIAVEVIARYRNPLEEMRRLAEGQAAKGPSADFLCQK